MKINLLLISTNKYHTFVQPLLEGIKKYFFIRHEIEVHLFTDKTDIEYGGNERVKIIKHKIPSYGFPEATLMRYHIFTEIKYDCDYLAYLDVDMSIEDFIDESILGELIAVLHPGFSVVGGGSWETNENSTSFIPIEKRKHYWAGGFQAGERDIYYSAMITMREMINIDKHNGIIPCWHDESAWNCYLSQSKILFIKSLDSSYCMVSQHNLREKWGISHLSPKIIALEKQHSEIRS